MVVADLTDPFKSSLLEALLREIQHQGYQALVTEIRGDNELDEVIRRFTQFRVSGVIVTSGQPPIEIVKECLSSNIPVVGINRHAPIPNVDFVCSDNRSGVKMAAEHLIKSGCKHIGWLNCASSTWSGTNRGEEFRKEIEQLKLSQRIETYTEFLTDTDSYDGGLEAAEKYINSSHYIDGLFSATAMLACGFLDGIRQHGINVPDDICLIGFDNTLITSQHSYQLTTIAQNTEATAKQAFDFLKSRTNNVELEQRTAYIPVSLIVRKTAP